ncbi:hypothetical protein AVEN_188962-1 [Araneus ventricosus]|uniref:Uncharacterized protein n=1 Tax=Araneus ventricosus TaxID=182803 RepID=A0A4Y2MUB4_ARAVE|nr:hypothetical protein AVEN_188962-1 [Araneus ventricosus]
MDGFEIEGLGLTPQNGRQVFVEAIPYPRVPSNELCGEQIFLTLQGDPSQKESLVCLFSFCDFSDLDLALFFDMLMPQGTGDG